MDWFWEWLAFSVAVGAYYNSTEVKKYNRKLEKRIKELEKEVKYRSQ